MKHFLFFTTISFLLLSCSKSDFKETKMAPQAAPQTAAAPDLSNKELPPGHPSIDGKTAPATDAKAAPAVVVGNIAKAKGGITVAESFEKNPKLKNTKVTIRGKVVKYNAGIMGKNWIHLRDGSGAEGKNDLVVTTVQTAKVNDVLLVTGTLQYDRDIGSGYFFPAIIEDASIKVE